MSTATNCTISGNTGRYGGGIGSTATLRITNCTLAGNTAYYGGGIYKNAGNLTLTNTIIANNVATIFGPDISGAAEAGDYNLVLVQDGNGATLSGTHNITGQDPLLGALAYNGGSTQTMALQSGSPAIDAGDPGFQALTNDQRGIGFVRVDNARVDIGAFEFDSETQPPELTTPGTNSATKSPVVITFTLPEAAQSGTVKLLFTRHDGGGYLRTLTLAAAMEGAGTHLFSFDPADVVASSGGAVDSISPNTAIFDAIWDVTLSYQDTAGHPAATTTNTSVTIDTVTLANPGLSSPATDAKIGGPFVSSSVASSLIFFLPEDAKPGSVTFTFDDGTTQYVLTTSAAAPMGKGLNQILFKPSDPVGASRLLYNGSTTVNQVAFASMTNGTSVPEGGPYSVSFTYQDKVGNSAVQSNVVTNVTIDTMTKTPTLTQPGANSFGRADVSVRFTLPEDAASGTLVLRFTKGAQNTDLYLDDSVATAGTHSFTFDATNPTGLAPVTSGNPLPDGTYTVRLSYQDSVLNPTATATNASVTIDTKPPTFNPSFSPLMVFAGTQIADYRSQAGASDENGLYLGGIVATQTPPAGTVLTAGTQQVTISVGDNAANIASISFNLTVRPEFPTSEVKLATGGAAPGAGTNGLPTGAKIASFNPPATDDAGDLAYVAKWTDADTKAKGTGLFLNSTCLAVVGGDASAIGGPGAKWKSFTDPVVSEGHLVCIASLSGVKTGKSIIVGNLTGTALEKIAQTDDPAVGTGNATFKSFKAVTIQALPGAPRLAYLAQLTPGTGAPKVTATNDTGLWYYEPGNPVFVVRESDQVAGRTIKTLVSFLPGSGSPGQGRGTLVNLPNGGNPLVTALAIFTDKSQGIISQNIDDGPPSLGLSLSGDLATGLNLGATFGSYSVPTRISTGTTAFLGKLTVENGVTKADASGIFIGPYMNGQFKTVIRSNVNASQAGTDAKFGVLKDPVLSEDGDIAFAATVTGLTGPGAQTLWWQPAGQSLQLLAQSGENVADLAGAKWKAFTSLAIAGGGRGPIFVATLVPNKTNVSKASATGVWACDFLGAPRLLFRTGVPDAIVTGRTLKKFTLLNATAGSTGVTRSFNNSAQVVWLATFDDKSQAIVTTEIP